MHKSTFFQIAIIFLVLTTVKAQADVAPPVLDPNIALFPRSSLHDFSDLVPVAPQSRGFLESRDGHFYWQDGSRARFWGINVANHTLMVPDEQIIAMVKNFQLAGFNLIRLHHFDERNGIIDMTRTDSQHLLQKRLQKLDLWIYQARLHGISIYLDLLDYRQFKAGDGVRNADAIGRAARPYAVFDERLIELQKKYAHDLFTHVNVYTGLTYADDPTVVMLEIYDESGLFMRRSVWRKMPEPYHSEFQRMWNDWLRERYKSTFALRAAWGKDVIKESESLENGTVQLPVMTWTPQKVSESQRFYAALPRRNDGARFAVEVHQQYFLEMRDYLRGIGVKIPVTVTGRFDDLADLKSIASKLDFIGISFYYDHPYWAAGKPAWQLPSYYHGTNPLQDLGPQSFAAVISQARIADKPLVVREWNYCWPNTWRGAGMLEAASYAAFLDVDAMILFTYETSNSARVSYFNVRSDPTRWGLSGIAAQIFLKQLIPPSRYQVTIPYSDQDVFTYTSYYQSLYALGWFARIEHDFYKNSYTAQDSQALLVASGRSSKAKISGAPAVLWNLNKGNRADSAAWDIPNKRLILGATTEHHALAGAMEALHRFYDAPFSSKMLASGEYISSEGRLRRNVKEGTLAIHTPQLLAVMGNLGEEAEIGALKVSGLDRGVLVLLSLDGLPIGQSQRFVLKMMTDARNVDQAVKRDPRFLHRPNGQWMLDIHGRGPVTDGIPSSQPVEVRLDGQLLVKSYQDGGSFELLVEEGHWKFFTDTPESRFLVNLGNNALIHGKTKKISSTQLQIMSQNGILKLISGLKQGSSVIARFPNDAAYIQFPVQRGLEQQ